MCAMFCLRSWHFCASLISGREFRPSPVSAHISGEWESQTSRHSTGAELTAISQATNHVEMTKSNHLPWSIALSDWKRRGKYCSNHVYWVDPGARFENLIVDLAICIRDGLARNDSLQFAHTLVARTCERVRGMKRQILYPDWLSSCVSVLICDYHCIINVLE